MCGQSIQETGNPLSASKIGAARQLFLPFWQRLDCPFVRVVGLVIAFCRAPLPACQPLLFIKE
jgi:hypothetical protein